VERVGKSISVSEHRIQKIGDYEDIRWFESSKLPIPGNPNKKKVTRGRTGDFLSRVVKAEEEKYHFGISGLRRPEDGSDRAFDP
jgi:hypothetical protein